MRMRQGIFSVIGLGALLSLSCGRGEMSQQMSEDEELFGGRDVSAFDLAKPGRFIVKFKDNVGLRSANGGLEKLQGLSANVLMELAPQNSMVVELNARQMAKLKRLPEVERIEVDPVRVPFAQQVPYGIDMVQAPLVWPEAKGDGRKVCIIDTGLYVAHEDIQDTNVTGAASGWNTDGCGHGTHVAGTIAGLDNDLGVVGVNKGNLALHIVKFFNDSCQAGFGSSLVDALNKCTAAGANVVSMSLGGSSSSATERDAFQKAWDQGVFVIAAAGNAGNTTKSYPASYPSVMSVAAIDKDKKVTSFSQKNDEVDIAAPGAGVLSTWPSKENSKVVVSGTEYAALGIEGSKRTDATGVTAALVDGGECAAQGTWTGKMVLCKRGGKDASGNNLTFFAKASNAQKGGASGVIIYNNVDGPFRGGFQQGETTTIPAVTITKADGDFLVANRLNTNANSVSQIIKPASGYDYLDGTSMACPHVSGVAALIWSKNPSWTNVQIREAMEKTAQDLGAPGRDNEYGHGLVQARAALDYLMGGTSNKLPTADFSHSCNGNNCNFTDASTDSDGTVTGWAWEFGDGSTSTVKSPSHAYTAQGSYTVKLTATDNKGGQGSVTKTITVGGGGNNNPPTASFTRSCVEQNCEFKDGSTDSDGRIAGWNWSFGDGQSSTAQHPSHDYAQAGEYTVSLRVTDDKGASTTTSQTFIVGTPKPKGITLTGTGTLIVSWYGIADISWEGANGANVDVYVDGDLHETTANDGNEQYDVWFPMGPVAFKVCEAGSTTNCSNEVSVPFQ